MTANVSSNSCSYRHYSESFSLIWDSQITAGQGEQNPEMDSEYPCPVNVLIIKAFALGLLETLGRRLINSSLPYRKGNDLTS